MSTRTFESASTIPIRYLAFPLLLSLAGCFTAPSPNVGKLKCTTDQQCPTGYSCLAPNQVGGCCKPGTLCPVTVPIDASNPDFSPVDLQMTSEAQVFTGNGDGGATLPIDAPMGIDLGTGGSGGMVDAIGSEVYGGSGGSTTPATDGAAAGGAGGTAPSDVSVSDSPADVPTRDVAIEGATPDVPAEAAIDAPGTCSVDKDCPAAAPLCLANKCAKCATDTDCAGRTGLACAQSGLCVACTADKYCTGTAAKCNTTTNQCTGRITRSDCSGTCQTCSIGVCTSVKNQDDPGVCTGTCDANGACKAKQGQTCQATTDCAGGLPCADGYCCNRACTATCEACDIAGSIGTCTALAANSPPRHGACNGSGTSCGGSCKGSTTCTYPSGTCGSASCNSSNGMNYQYQGAGACNSGSCVSPGATNCSYGCDVSVAGGCTGNCVPTTKNCISDAYAQQCSPSGQMVQTSCLALGKWCNGGSCVPLLSPGDACTAPDQCVTDTCNGISDTTGTCRSLVGGSCPVDTSGQSPACVVDTYCSGGVCTCCLG